MSVNMDEFLERMNFGEDGESDALRYLRIDMVGLESEHAVDMMLVEALGMADYAKVKMGAESLRKFVYGMVAPYIHNADDPATWYLDAAAAFEKSNDEALEMLAEHRRMALEIAETADVVRAFLPGSSEGNEGFSPRPVNDLAELRVSPFWEVSFPFIVTVGSYAKSDASDHALNFVRQMKGHEFLAWMNRELVVLARLSTAAVQIIDEAVYRVEAGALTDEG